VSTRLSVDLLFIGLIGTILGWLARAPADPPARAAYLCAPVIVMASVTAHLESMLADEDRIVPPTPPWRFDAGRACMRLVVRVSEDLEH
jgi:hypothetical protein